jgi:PAS domain S-box-containing protein
MLSRARQRTGTFLRRATDESIRADVVGTLFLLGALLAIISLVFPHPDAGIGLIWAVIAAAAAAGVILLGRSTSWSKGAIHVAVAFGSLCINLLMLASDVAAGVYAAMFCWVVLVSVNFFSWKAAIAHFAWMMGIFAFVLTQIESSGGYSGVTRWLTATLALAVTGGATGWLVYRRRLAEEATQRFLDLAEEMLCTIRVDGRLLRVNRAWERVLAYPLYSLRSLPVLELVHPDDVAETERALDEVTRAEQSVTIDNRLRLGDGSYRRMRWRATYAAEERLIYARIRPHRAADAIRAEVA